MKIARKIPSVLFTLLVLMLIFLAYGSIGNRWYRVVTVEGDSMAPTLRIGDMMIVTPAPQEIKPDTIVVMRLGGDLVTHRLVGYDENHRPITKGDANETVDAFQNPNLKIVGVFRLRLPGFGYPILMLSRLLDRA